MKKGINKSILFYIASVLFFIASAIGFTSGNESSMAIVWLCLGSSFLCLPYFTNRKRTQAYWLMGSATQTLFAET